MEYLKYIELIAAAYLMFIATMMQTKNMRSSLIFKFIPSMIVVGLLLDAAIRFGFVLAL